MFCTLYPQQTNRVADQYLTNAVPTTDPTNYGNMPGSGDGPLRPGGVAGSLPVSDKANLPDTLSPAAAKQQAALELVRDLAEGADRVRYKGPQYLPKAPGEDPQNYANRLARSVFLNAFAQTIEGLAGFVFRRDPVLGDDVPPVIVQHTENIDNAGAHLDVFLRDRLEDALTAGHSAVLVDYPDTGGATLSLADEKGLRPYWVPILKDNILSWRTSVESGVTVLDQVVLRECQYVPDGMFGEKEQTRYRMLYRNPQQDPPVGYVLLEITKDKRVIEVERGYYRNQTEIPLAEIRSSGRTSLFESVPPLIDLAHLNVAHYQQWSDYATSLHLTCVPFLFFAGGDNSDETGQKVIIGPSSVVTAADSNAKAQYVSHDGRALDVCQKSLDDLLRDMATFGLSMLSPDKKAQDSSTATARRIDKASNDSSLSVVARGLQDGVERCLQFHANYLGLDSGGSIRINRDFENLSMTPVEIAALSNMVVQGLLSQETMWTMLQEGNVLPQDLDFDEERAQIAADATTKAAVNEANGLNPDGSVKAPKPAGAMEVQNPDGSTKFKLKRTA